MLDGVERNGERQIRQVCVDAVLLSDRHLVFLEIEVGYALFKGANHEFLGELVLIGKAGGCDGLQSPQEVRVGLVPLLDGGKRVVSELVVVAIVTESGCALRKIAEIGFVLLVKERVLCGEAVGDRLILSKGSGCKQEENKAAKAHGVGKGIRGCSALSEGAFDWSRSPG